MRRLLKNLLAAAAVALGVAAGAGTSHAAFHVEKYGVTVGVGTFTLSGYGATISGSNAGTFEWKATEASADNPYGNGTVFRTFCIELQGFTGTTYVFTGMPLAQLPTTLNSPDGMGAAKAADLQVFFQRYAGTISDLLNPAVTDSATASTATKILAAAFQLAIWEIVYENSGTFDVTVGDPVSGFKATAEQPNANLTAALTQANELLAGTDFTKNPSQEFIDNVRGFKVTNSETDQQDQVGLVPGDYDDEVETVPAPAGVVLLATALPVLGLRRILRRKTA